MSKCMNDYKITVSIDKRHEHYTKKERHSVNRNIFDRLKKNDEDEQKEKMRADNNCCAIKLKNRGNETEKEAE